MKDLIQVTNLTITIKKNSVSLVRNISFSLPVGTITGLVGESGSGKSITARSLMRINHHSLDVIGDIRMMTEERTIPLSKLTETDLTQIRGNEIGMIFQNPMSSLNPSIKVGKQVAEAIRIHNDTTIKKAKQLVLESFQKVYLPDIGRIYNSYPFQLSGGQLQRVMIAMALINNPKLLIADEATTALDVTVQAEIIDLLKKLRKEFGLTVLFITHDLSLLNNFADQVLVMNKGEIVEQGSAKEILNDPKHIYTKALLNCRPEAVEKKYRLPGIDDFTLNNGVLKPRHEVHIDKRDMLHVNRLNVTYNTGKKNNKKAVKEVSFDIHKGETVGLVGESGCGKTTLSKTLLQLLPFEGQILFNGIPVSTKTRKEEKEFRKTVQFVFQDPYSSLNPLKKIKTVLSEPLQVHKIVRGNAPLQRINALLNQVGLDETYMDRYPHELSGGQRQRLAIARALAVEPQLLILDEAVSALDVSVQAKVLNLLNDLKAQLGLTYLFISHDLSVVHYMSERIMVMKNGELVEFDDADLVFKQPKSDYTKRLIDTIPK